MIFRNYWFVKFLIFWYFVFLWDLKVANRGIFGQNSRFLPKKSHYFALGATLGSHKKTKKQNIKNLTNRKFLNITRNIYTKNWTNRANIEEGVGNFLRSLGMHFFAKKKQKNKFDFSAENGHFLANFSKHLEINKNHLNTFYVQILGHLDHYWAQNSCFFVFLTPIFPFIINRRN